MLRNREPERLMQPVAAATGLWGLPRAAAVVGSLCRSHFVIYAESAASIRGIEAVMGGVFLVWVPLGTPGSKGSDGERLPLFIKVLRKPEPWEC